MKTLHFITLIIALLLIGSTFIPVNEQSTQITEGAYFQVDNNTMYYNRYDVYKTINGEQVLNTSSYESGSFNLSDGVVNINRGIEQRIYIIDEKVYDDYEQTHTFYANDGTIITLDVCERTLKIDNNGEGIILRINSTIKSNW